MLSLLGRLPIAAVPIVYVSSEPVNGVVSVDLPAGALQSSTMHPPGEVSLAPDVVGTPQRDFPAKDSHQGGAFLAGIEGGLTKLPAMRQRQG